MVVGGFATEVLYAVTGAVEAGYRALVPVDARRLCVRSRDTAQK